MTEQRSGSRLRQLAATSPFAAYLLLSFGIAWLGWLPLAIYTQIKPGFAIPNAVYVLSPFACGPTLAALAVHWLTGGKAGVQRLLRRLLLWKVGLRWYLFAILSPAALFLTSLWVKGFFTHTVVDLGASPVRLMYPQVSPLVILPVSLLTGLFIGPLNEEIGWRGFALPHLQSRYNSLTASLILGAIWAVWHLPLFFISGMSQVGQPLLPFFVSIVVNTFFYTWLSNRTGGNLLMAVLLHDAFNTTTAFIPALPSDIWSIGITVLAVVALIAGNRKEWLRSPAPGHGHRCTG